MTRNYTFVLAGVLSLTAAASAFAVGPTRTIPPAEAPELAQTYKKRFMRYERAPGATDEQFQAACRQAGGTIKGGLCQIAGRNPNSPPPPGLVGQTRLLNAPGQ